MASQLELLSARFRQFAVRECKDSSPLYARLSNYMAETPKLLSMALDCPAGQPPPNLFFAAVQYLLLDYLDAPLAQYYPRLKASTEKSIALEPAFLDFCLAHQKQIRELISSRRVQTNEVRRCAYLLPAYEFVVRKGEGSPLSIIDVGASAGLHMLWSRYRYEFGTHGKYGDPSSPVSIESEIRGEIHPPLSQQFPQVACSIGVDLNPVDLSDPDTLRWFEALIWPEHSDRIELLQGAIQIALEERPQLVEGDIVSRIPELARMAPKDSTLCLYHSHILYQLSGAEFSQYEQQVRELAKDRDIYWLVAEADQLQVRVFKASGETTKTLARVHGHGRWFEWLVNC